jgi:hypothetical protein
MSDPIQTTTLCKARRRNGEPCRNPPMMGAAVCRMHGGAAPQVRARAQQRILEASDLAAGRLVQLMQDKNVPYAVQLAAARDLLDRAGVVQKQEVVVVEVQPWLNVMEQILVDVLDDDIEDAVIVPEPKAIAQAQQDEEVESRHLERQRNIRKGAPATRPSDQKERDARLVAAIEAELLAKAEDTKRRMRRRR